MKKTIIFIVVGIMALSLVACSNKSPSLKEVEKAIADGTITVQDAFDRGYVDKKWVAEYEAKKEELSVPASDKLTSNTISEFETTTFHGQIFTQADLSPVTYFAFLNPNSEEGKNAYNAIMESYEEIIAGQGDVLIVNTSNEQHDLFVDSKFIVVQYNDSMKKALGHLTEMVQEDTFSGAWNGNSAFLSSWSMVLDSKSFLESMTGIVDLIIENYTGEENTGDNITAVPMG